MFSAIKWLPHAACLQKDTSLQNLNWFLLFPRRLNRKLQPSLFKHTFQNTRISLHTRTRVGIAQPV